MTRPGHHPERHGLATRNGVSPSCVSLQAGPWVTILDFLVQRFPTVSPGTWQERMQAGEVVDEHGQAVTPERPYQWPLRVYYYRTLPSEPRIPFDEVVLFADKHVVVVDKPHFLPVLPSGNYLHESVLVRLKQRLGLDSLSPLHRIDRETAGLVLFGVQAHERGAYQEMFRLHQIAKYYEAIAPWRGELTFPLERKSRIVEGQPFFRQCEVPGVANSHTHIELLQVQGSHARYGLRPISGKKHQLRVHMNALGLPIVDDRLYPPVEPALPDDYRYPLQLLAKSIAFIDPITGQQRQFESQLKLVL